MGRPKGMPKQPLNLRLDADIVHRMKMRALNSNVTVSEMVTRLFLDFEEPPATVAPQPERKSDVQVFYAMAP